MNERKLRRRCKRMLQDLGIQPPLKVDVLCRLLGAHRGRPIQLAPYSLPVPGPFGMWIATGSADYILYQKETSHAHQDHIILHEIGHILADHKSDESTDEAWQQMMPDISPDAIKKALRRTSYDEDHEREAELVATIILEWASVLDQVTPQTPKDTSARRLQTALSDRQGWL